MPVRESPLRPLVVAERDRWIAHYVTDAQVLAHAAGLDARALCGRRFRPACLSAPVGPVCAGCRRARSGPPRSSLPVGRRVLAALSPLRRARG